MSAQDLDSGPVDSIEEEKIKLPKKLFRYLQLVVYTEPTAVDTILLIVGSIAAIAAGVPFPILGILFGQLVDDLNSATCNTAQELTRAAEYQAAVNDKVLKVVYVTIASFITIYVYIVCWSLIGQRLAHRLRDKYFRSLLRQEISFFDNLPAGKVSSRLNGDIQTIQAGTSEKVGICISSLSFFITAYVVAFIKDPKLAGMLVSIVPAFLLMSLVGSKYIEKYSGRMSDYVASAASIASEGLSHVAVVHAFSANARLETKFAADLIKAQKEGIKKAIATAAQSGLLYFIAYSANALAFWQGSRIIADTVGRNAVDATVGTTYTVIFILVDASLILSQVAPFLQVFGSAAAAFEKLQSDMSNNSEIDGTLDTGGEILSEVSGHIDFRNVSFSYSSRPNQSVLQNLSMGCPVGKHTAIVGISGSGKSTIAGLVTRLYDPTGGNVFLDGHDLQELNVRQLRSFISLVQQEPSLLDRSILENIALGLVNSPSTAHSHLKATLLSSQLSEVASRIRNGQDIASAVGSHGSAVAEIVDLVREAATLADAADFIDCFEHGFGTLVGSIGNLMSGGQKQRIALARALVKDPKILILDEATSSLDSLSEKRIQTAIEKIAEGRTLISIAHRLSTIKKADNIIFLRQGQILEHGTHAELLSQNGAYAAMIRLQDLNGRSTYDQTPPKASILNGPNSSEDKLSRDQTGVAEEETTEKGTFRLEEGTRTPKSSGSKGITGIASERPPLSIVKGMAPMARPYLLWIFVAFSASTIVGSSYSAEAVIFGNTVGSLSPCKSEDTIRSRGRLFGLLFFVLALVEFFANLISWSAFGWVAEKLLYTVRVLSFRSLFEQDLQWHQSEGRNPALLLSFVTKDGNALSSLTGSVIGTIFSILVNLIAAIVLTHIVAWRIALVCLVTVPILLGAGFMQLRALTQFEERHEQAFAKSVGITVEAVDSIKTVASLSLEHEILGVYRRSLRNPRKEITKASAYANLWLAIAYSVGNLVYALAYWWGAKQIISGRYTQTQFFIVLLALLVSAQLWAQMFTLAPDVSRARASVARILNLLDIGSTRPSSSGATALALPGSREKDIEATAGLATRCIGVKGGVSVVFRQVQFAYPARHHIQVLHGLDFEIQPGQFCALFGPSGAGKSTIISLIERMYSPSSGIVEIDGKDISKHESVAFRDDIALVSQDSVLFEGSIRFNVALGAKPDQEATDAEVEEACRLANIHETIVDLPEGYETQCGPNGNQLSGGQRQRLAIARALVRKPRLLLLDESTSALDAESEKLLQDGLEKAARGITVVAIAHRLHTIKKADVIFLIEGGRCVDRGTHKELFGRSESYRINAMHQTFEA
ncbi:ATP-binding cassette transporter [Glonium stellatum]|uniref:ATP-binding cassette transporter n=1 Tax=Glonium stellatum TaxID=574774 RepID=A0A8E2ET48_9PEZI|nr:ATP-binding cassette transporter [Glonium stellatum]